MISIFEIKVESFCYSSHTYVHIYRLHIYQKMKQTVGKRDEKLIWFIGEWCLSPKLFCVFKAESEWKLTENLYLNWTEAILPFPVSYVGADLSVLLKQINSMLHLYIFFSNVQDKFIFIFLFSCISSLRFSFRMAFVLFAFEATILIKKAYKSNLKGTERNTHSEYIWLI